MNIILFTIFIFICANADCPLNHYPRFTVNGFINAQISTVRTVKQFKDQYTYILQQPFASKGISVAISAVGFNLAPVNNNLDFKIINLPLSQYDKLRFQLQLTESGNLWKQLKWNFLGTQNAQFSVYNQLDIQKFSVGKQVGTYSVYRVLHLYDNFSVNPKIKVFISGLTLQEKYQNPAQTIEMQNQLSIVKNSGANARLIKLIEEAIEIQKSITFKIENVKIIGKIVGFNIKSNIQLKKLSFSYIFYSADSLIEKHNRIQGDFGIVDQSYKTITILSNMKMLFTGLTQFSIPQNQPYQFQLIFEEKFNQGYFSVNSKKPYFKLGFTYIALQMQRQFVCQDCQNSPHIFQQKYCVRLCPRGYSVIQKLDNTYCEKCLIQQLKVVDPLTNQCVCAIRHYLNHSQNKCYPCSYDCYTCSTSDFCLTCDFNQTKRIMSDNNRCQCPVVGYYDNQIIQDIVCQKCHIGCRTCDGPQAHDCLTCYDGKTLDVLGFCICQKGFQSAHDGSCYCPPPKVIDNEYCILNGTECEQNKQPQFVDLTRRCICKSDFIQVLEQCIKCQGNSIFDQQQLECKCSNQTIYLNGECVSCGINQVYDTVQKRCKCAKNTFKTEQGNCIVCPQGMGYLNGNCQCPFNYYEQNQKCFRCKSSTDGPLCRKGY